MEILVQKLSELFGGWLYSCPGSTLLHESTIDASSRDEVYGIKPTISNDVIMITMNKLNHLN